MGCSTGVFITNECLLFGACKSHYRKAPIASLLRMICKKNGLSSPKCKKKWLDLAWILATLELEGMSSSTPAKSLFVIRILQQTQTLFGVLKCLIEHAKVVRMATAVSTCFLPRLRHHSPRRWRFCVSGVGPLWYV